ncbi:MAG: sulfatase-like hydrolase/transferase [Candidatus Coatesbacteria bacterium]
MTVARNLVVFFTDQQRWDSCGCYGNPLGLTPRLDAMAARGTRFEHAFTVQPVCAPARACLQTGLYATRHGVWRNAIPLDPALPTLARAFRAAGGFAGYIGKWHLGDSACHGQTLGDQDPVPPRLRGGYDDHWLAADVLEFCSHPYRLRLFDGDGKIVERPGYRVDAQTDLVLEALEDRAHHPDRPFLLFVSYLEPHFQNDLDLFVGPRGEAEALARKGWMPPDLAALQGSAALHLPGYLSCVASLDRNLGRVLDQLAKTGMDHDTAVLFTSDHGCHFKTRNGEYKRSCHESSIRIPAVMQGPGFDGGGKVDEMVTLLDLHASLLEATGLPLLPGCDGLATQRLVEGRRDGWPDDVFVQISESQVGRAIRTRRWKYSVTAPGVKGWDVPASAGYVDECLYDLDRDPAELENLVGRPEFRAVRDDLAARLLRRMRGAGEPAPALSFTR